MEESRKILTKKILLFREEFIKYFPNKSDFSKFIGKLIYKVHNNENITENPMLDGLIIGYMIVKEKQIYGILSESSGMYSDDTIIFCQSIFRYMIENWDKLKGINNS